MLSYEYDALFTQQFYDEATFVPPVKESFNLRSLQTLEEFGDTGKRQGTFGDVRRCLKTLEDLWGLLITLENVKVLWKIL